MKSLIVLSIILASSCAAKTVPVQVSLPCPEPLELPKLLDDLKPQVGEMSVELQNFFFQRDKLQIKRRETLQNICRSTHK